MHYRIIILLLFSTHFVYLSVEGQGGWVRQKKSLFLKTDVSSLEAENFYNVTGSKLKTNAFKQNTIGIYGEYGIHDRFTILLNAPILRINSFETTEKVFGMGDPRIGIKYRLTPADKLPIAISIEPELPLGRKNAFAKNLDNKNDIINLPTGDGEFNIWSTLALSIPLSSRLYVSGYGAYNMRTTFEGEKFRNLYQIGGEIGFSPLKDM